MSEVHNKRIRGDSSELQKEKFCLGIKKRKKTQQKRLTLKEASQKAVGAPSLAVFRTKS